MTESITNKTTSTTVNKTTSTNTTTSMETTISSTAGTSIATDTTVWRRRWSAALIERAPDAPAYGSPEWCALPEGPEKVAAVVRAAECWARDGDDLTERLRVDVEASQTAYRAAEDADWLAHRDWHRERWRGGRYWPTAADVAEVEADWLAWIQEVAR